MHPTNSRVLIVGASKFPSDPGLDDLPSVPPGVKELRSLLIKPDVGGLAESACRLALDPRTPDEVDAALWNCAEEAKHTLLVYYSGHGVPHPHDGSLHLAVGVTKRLRLHATAWPIEWIRRALIESEAETKVVILDCCFSGRAIQTMGADSIAAQGAAGGSIVIAAAPATRLAAAPAGESFTAFTGALLAILRDGVPDGPPMLDLDTVFRSVRAALTGRGLPPPQVQRTNDAATLALGRNRAVKSPEQLRIEWEETLKALREAGIEFGLPEGGIEGGLPDSGVHGG
jgi:hypothetical protein